MPHMPPARRLAAPMGVALALAAAACGSHPPQPAPGAHQPDTRIRALLGHGDQPVLALASGDTVRLDSEVVAFYRERDWHAAWTDAHGFLPRGKRLVALLDDSGADGLDQAAYHRHFSELVERVKREVKQDLPVGDLLGNLDVLLTEAFLRYSSDMRRGVMDPRSAGLDWRIPREDPTDAQFLNRLLEDGDLEAAVDSLRPSTPFYGRLKASLARYRAIEADGGWPRVDGGAPLSEGDQGPRVAQVRRRLQAERDPVEARLAAAGARPRLYDADLAEAVKHFQRRHGIEPDGAVGPETRAAMNVPVEDRVFAIKLNLDRWRWLPRDLGERFVLVNVAGQELAVIDHGKPALTMNVIVGQVGKKTPIFQDTMQYVVVNPYWNVPEGIAEKEIWPKVERDPTYLASHHYEVQGSGPDRTVRQLPGPHNALGQVKFLFPNDMDVYLHDTPADHLFSRTSRAFSHGCIRVEKPVALAHWVFQNATSRRPEDFDSLLATGENKWVSLTHPLPVYILYFTAWADQDGSTRFYPDLYERDRAVARVAREKLDSAGPAGTSGNAAERPTA